MAEFSKFFRLNANQAQLDFVDIDTSADSAVYVDPYAIEIQNDVWAKSASEHIRNFFSEILKTLRSGDKVRAMNLMSHLS